MVENIQCFAPKDTFNLNDAFDEDMIVLPLQYTGLKDKNGVEIYEGDIVRQYDSWSRYYYLDKLTDDDDANPIGVVAITASAGVVCKWPSGRYTQAWEDHMTSGERPLKGRWTIYSSGKRWEVIGNIYENPELLEK